MLWRTTQGSLSRTSRRSGLFRLALTPISPAPTTKRATMPIEPSAHNLPSFEPSSSSATPSAAAPFNVSPAGPPPPKIPNLVPRSTPPDAERAANAAGLEAFVKQKQADERCVPPALQAVETGEWERLTSRSCSLALMGST